METKKFPRIWIILFVVLLGLVVSLYIPRLIHPITYEVERLTEWTYNGNETITLPGPLKQDAQGDIALTTRLPQQMGKDCYLFFWTYYSEVEVLVGDTPIYHHNDVGTGSFGTAPSSKWNTVKLPADAAGKPITLRIDSPYTKLNLRLSDIIVGELPALHAWLHSRFALYNAIDSAVMLAALGCIVLSFVRRIEPKRKRYPLFAGLFLLLFCLYIRTGIKAMPIEWLSPFARDFICYFCIFSLAIPFTLYTRERVRNHPKQVRWCNLLTIAEGVVMIVALTLHAIGIVDIYYPLLIAYLLLATAVITATVYTVAHFLKRRDKWSAIAVVSPVSVLLALVLEYLQFYLMGNMKFDTGWMCHISAVAVLLIEGSLYFRQQRMEFIKTLRVREENRNLQIQMLTDRIRPHFILNTVGAIRALIPRDPDRASDLLYDFSKYMREKMEQKDYSKPIPFKEELEHIRTYLKLEQARFGDTVQVNYDLQDASFLVLPLTIQPFVENAIKHGLFQTEDGGVLTISSYAGDGCHVVEVADNGVGFDATNLDAMLENKSSVGLRSALMRLENGMKAKITIHSCTDAKRSGTQVRIEIPESR